MQESYDTFVTSCIKVGGPKKPRIQDCQTSTNVCKVSKICAQFLSCVKVNFLCESEPAFVPNDHLYEYFFGEADEHQRMANLHRNLWII